MRDERAHLQLFDLIAREWSLPAAVDQVLFNAAGSAVAFASADGAVHLAAVADRESANSRVRRALDTGRLTIAPRAKPCPPLKPCDHTLGRSSLLARLGPSGFAFGKTTGRINSVSPGGIAAHIPARCDGPVSALAATPDGGIVAYGCGAEVHLAPRDESQDLTLTAPAEVTALAFSPDGQELAVAHGLGLTRWRMTDLAAPLAEISLPRPVALVWDETAQRLAALMEGDGFCLIDAVTGAVERQGSFPAPVRSLSFSRPGKAVLASGAFRVAGWAEGVPVSTGRPGLVLVEAVAAAPNRPLVAVGYANGLLSLAEIGGPSEILLRENTGAAVTALAFSPDGACLALGSADGSAALVELPDAMFKS